MAEEQDPIIQDRRGQRRESEAPSASPPRRSPQIVLTVLNEGRDVQIQFELSEINPDQAIGYLYRALEHLKRQAQAATCAQLIRVVTRPGPGLRY